MDQWITTGSIAVARRMPCILIWIHPRAGNGVTLVNAESHWGRINPQAGILLRKSRDWILGKIKNVITATTCPCDPGQIPLVLWASMSLQIEEKRMKGINTPFLL